MRSLSLLVLCLALSASAQGWLAGGAEVSVSLERSRVSFPTPVLEAGYRQGNLAFSLGWPPTSGAFAPKVGLASDLIVNGKEGWLEVGAGYHTGAGLPFLYLGALFPPLRFLLLAEWSQGLLRYRPFLGGGWVFR